MSRTRIKICGVTTPEDALWAVECGADALGFVFVESSPRCIEPRAAWEIVSYLPPLVTSVGLIANASLDRLAGIAEQCPCDCFQLHGDESPEEVGTLASGGGRLIKAIQFRAESAESDLARWERVSEIEALLVDGSPGGQGRALDWTGLSRFAERMVHPLIVAGGLTPENVGEAIASLKPYAVDVSSGVERRRGEKDPELIAAFCQAVQRADAQAG